MFVVDFVNEVELTAISKKGLDCRDAYDSTNVLEEATGRQLIRFSVLTFFKNRKKVNLMCALHE